MKKKAIVIHSGGMDSSICLALAMEEFGKEQVLSLSFRYDQRHVAELRQAAKICRDWGVDHAVLSIDCLKEITTNALLDPEMAIEHPEEGPPNTLVVGRNGLMARLGAIHAEHLGAHCLYMGVIEVEEANSGYRDCSRRYMDLMQEILRIDLGDPAFEIRTPLVKMTKKETLAVADRLGVLAYLLKETISCYEGLPGEGCGKCPACKLRNEGVRQYRQG
jgi:7-cyano-7-deazaguanine synthase